MWVPINKLCGTSSFTSLGDIPKTCGFPFWDIFFFNFILRQIKVKEEVGVFVEKTFQEFETLCDVVNHGKGEIVQKNISAMDLYFVFILYHSYFESLSVFLFFVFCQVSRFWCWIAYSVGRYYVGHICL